MKANILILISIIGRIGTLSPIERVSYQNFNLHALNVTEFLYSQLELLEYTNMLKQSILIFQAVTIPSSLLSQSSNRI